jgi:hypothetical protein
MGDGTGRGTWDTNNRCQDIEIEVNMNLQITSHGLTIYTKSNRKVTVGSTAGSTG